MRPEPPVTITVRARPDRPLAALELRGELPHWSAPHPMTAAGDGFEVALALGAGVYPIKAHAPDGTWWLDPRWRTVREGDDDNGVVVVGGTVEPVLHAPAPPWLDRRDDGAVIVRASLRRGHGRGLAIRADDGGGVVTRPMRVVDADAAHVHFEVALAGAGRRLEYAFALDDGRTVGGDGGAWLRVDLAALPPAPPAWWPGAVVYTVFVDRFRRAAGWADPDRCDRDHHAGGDLDGVIAALPYLIDLGVTALHLTPIGPARSPHRYDAVDPRAVDPALGGDAGFERLLAAAHRAGLRVLVDLAITHVHRDAPQFQDVLARGPASPYWSWFRVRHWPCFDGPEPGYDHYHKGQWREPLLALDEPEVADWVVETFAAWARRGVDGVRVDAAADVPVALIARIRTAVRAIQPDAVVFGEVVPACLDRFAPAALDAGTDFAAQGALVDWLAGRSAAAGLAAVWARQRRRGVAGPRGLGFTGTHDQPRIATVTDPARARLGLLAIALGARVPLLYYGDEIGLAAAAAAADRGFEDSWPDRQPMRWDASGWDGATHALVRAALGLRRDREVLRGGDEVVWADGEVVVLRRTHGDQTVDVLLHRGAEAVTIALPPGDAAAVLLATGGAHLSGGPDNPQAILPPASGLVLDRAAPPLPQAQVLVARNTELAAEAFVAGMVTIPTYPTRLYLTVTEACNLRCRHCITDAPARTQGGRARTLAPWLLDGLDEAFAHADYVGFTHGGEALASPRLPEVLRRLGAARARRPGRLDVHLASNGMLLDGERVRELVGLGVTSLMVSLDGATAATNDRIRVLGKLDRVVANLAAAVAWRTRTGADLRIGVSTVVGRINLAELPALGRLCAGLGLDWLKVEETYPVNGFARTDALAPTDPALADALAGLRTAVTDSPLVLVDHLAAPAGCTCTAADDPAVTRFRAADDYANRATFRPCRAAWEQAAIDPDGIVHLIDHAGPVLGNLLDAPLLPLWNARAAVAARGSALHAAPAAQRRRCTSRP